jgi:Tol biopolymer transport system component
LVPDVAGRLTAALSDRYRLERELGAGGMATVYLAADLKHDRQVAIKVLKPELAAVLGADRFVQEIKTTAALQHPHILPLFDSGQAIVPPLRVAERGTGGEAFLYYVMPYIEGETLRTRLNREHQLGVEEAVKITTEVADALDYAHRHGVIHRDIKPENILLHDGRPMVADFGIALAVSAAAGGRMTETGLSLGTPHYMSPEQATADRDITGRSDIYSLAAVLYEMLTGDPPHTASSAQAIIMKIVTEDVAPVTKLRKTVPPNVAAALGMALEKLPADRFDSAKAFREALTRPGFRSGEATVAALSAPGTVRSRLPWLIAAASLLTALVAWLVKPTAKPETRAPWFVDLNVPDSAEMRNGLALSPDGSTIAWGGPRALWMRSAGALAPVPVGGTDGGCCPAFSPDGQQLAFVRGRELYVIPVTGGTGKLLGTGFSAGDDIAWTADGYIVGVSDAGGLAGFGGLIRVPASGGAVEQFTHLDTLAGEAAHWSPRALPNGQGVLFTIVPAARTDSLGLRIAVVGPRGGPHTVVMPGRVATFAPPDHLIVTSGDGTVVAVPFDLATRRLTGDPAPLFTVPQAAATFTWRGYATVGPSGNVVYVGGTDPPRELVWVDRTGRMTPAEFDSRFAFRRPSISRDGGVIAFEAFLDSDRPTIEVRELRTGADSRIEIPGGRVSDVWMAGDGHTLLFRAVAPGKRGIFSAQLGRLREHTLLLSDAAALKPSLSPDGHILYVVRAGDRSLQFVAYPLGQPQSAEQVLLTGGNDPAWEPQVSPDGRWVAYVEAGGSGGELYVRSTDPNRTERWSVSSPVGASIAWSRNAEELYFITRDTMKVAHVSVSPTFTVHRIESLFALRAEYAAGISTETLASFAVGADGRFLIARQRSGASGGNRLMLLDDWRSLAPGR